MSGGETPDASCERAEVSADWYAQAFGALYPVVYTHRTVEAAEPEALFAARHLGLGADDLVLDLCCGNGRHMVHLAHTAGAIVGLDYSPDLLRIAAAHHAGPLLRADMRRIPFVDAFDVIVNFFTSFGYFQMREENLAVVQGVARALRPGGRFFIDYLNPAYVKRTLVPESLRENGAYTIRERRWIDDAKQRVNKATTVLKDGTKIAEMGESVRLYALHELQTLLSEGGLHIDEMFGDYTGVPVDDAQPRVIVVGRRGDRGGAR